MKIIKFLKTIDPIIPKDQEDFLIIKSRILDIIRDNLSDQETNSKVNIIN
jgi:hypothetical protein